jgi:hypothetical protein
MSKKRNDERPARLLVWFRDGMCGGYDARVPADVEVSIGRTDSKQALGSSRRLALRGQQWLPGGGAHGDPWNCADIAGQSLPTAGFAALAVSGIDSIFSSTCGSMIGGVRNVNSPQPVPGW